MQTKFIEKRIDYTGAELRSHFAYTEFGILGNSIISFIGKCDIKPEKMVDMVDAKEHSKIYSKEMLHFIVELFDSDLEKTILIQRILICIIRDEILLSIQPLKKSNNPSTPSFAKEGQWGLFRKGNDLFDNDCKLSISIATVSPISSLIHTGINIISKGTPVKTKGLKDYNINPRDFALKIMENFKNELEGIWIARSKVKWVT